MLIGIVVFAVSMPALLRGYEPYFLHLHDVICVEDGSFSTSSSDGPQPDRSWQAPLHVRATLPGTQVTGRKKHAHVRFFIGFPSPTVLDSYASTLFKHLRSGAPAVPMNTRLVHCRLVVSSPRTESA